MSSSDPINGSGGEGELADAHVVELVAASTAGDSISEEQIKPLLENPKINIFSVSYPRQKPNREQVTRLAATEISPFTQSFMWVWTGSRYSGLLCMALSSTIYCIMEVLSDIFSAQSIPLFEITSTRCSIITILSFMWLRRNGQPTFGPTNVRNLLVSRSLTGCLSLLSFIYCIQRLPLSQAIILSFTTPIMASIAARVILHEKLKIAEIGGLACSFFGVLFVFRPMFNTQGGLAKAAEASDSNVLGSNLIYAVFIALFSSVTGGISYCLIRAGAKASDHPVVTVFSFGIPASPASVICTFAFEDFVLPSLYSFILIVALGVLAFVAEVFLARGLQLEKTSRVTNIQYLELRDNTYNITHKISLVTVTTEPKVQLIPQFWVKRRKQNIYGEPILAALSQLWAMGSSKFAPSFGRLVGCSLILVSAFCTMYIGPEKDIE